MKKVRMQQVQD